jgi:hypothetical protein
VDDTGSVVPAINNPTINNQFSCGRRMKPQILAATRNRRNASASHSNRKARLSWCAGTGSHPVQEVVTGYRNFTHDESRGEGRDTVRTEETAVIEAEAVASGGSGGEGQRRGAGGV